MQDKQHKENKKTSPNSNKRQTTMKTTIEYLDEAKKKLEIGSDYGIAQWLNVTRQAINNWRKERQVMDDYAAMRIAEALEIDPLEVIAAANIEREKDEKRQEHWRKIFARCAAAGFFMMVSALEIIDLGQGATEDSTHYAQCRRWCNNTKNRL